MLYCDNKVSVVLTDLWLIVAITYLTVLMQVCLCDDLDIGRQLALKEVQIDSNTPQKVAT